MMKPMDGITFSGLQAEKLRACHGRSLHVLESKGIPVFAADETGLISPLDAPKVPQYFQSAIRIGGEGVRLWYEVLVSWFQRTGVDVEVSAALCESRASGPFQFEKRPLYSKQFTDFTDVLRSAVDEAKVGALAAVGADSGESPFAETARIQAERGFTHQGFDVPVVRDGWGHRFALPWNMAGGSDSEEAIRAQIDRYVYVRSLPKTPIEQTSIGEVIAVDGHGETRACKVELHRGNFRVLVDARGQRALYCGNEHTGWVGGEESSAEALLQRAKDRTAAFAGANASSRRDAEVEGHSPLQM